MTERIPASKMLTAFLRDAIAPALADAGFKGRSRTFRRTRGDAVQVVEILLHKLNDAKRARFALEFGLCFPRLCSLAMDAGIAEAGRFDTAQPGITDCVLRRRLGEFLADPTDLWFTVSAVTQHVPEASDVVSPFVERALPWLDACATLPATVSAPELQRPLVDWRLQVLALAMTGAEAAAVQLARDHVAALRPADPGAMLQALARGVARAVEAGGSSSATAAGLTYHRTE